jgi:hypothetical protein
MTVASRSLSPTQSFHARESNVGSQNLTPSHLQAVKVLERAVPKDQFSGKTNDMNFERFMETMEQDMSVEGITDELRVKNIDNWFSGRALKIVRSKKNNDIRIDATTTLNNIKESLNYHFRSKSLIKKEFDVKGMLKDLVKGKPIVRGDFESTQTFIIDLECQLDLARGKGKEAIFEQKDTYIDIMNAKLPYLMEGWTREFETGRRGVNFKAFTMFVLDEAMIEEKSTKYRGQSTRSDSAEKR